jgi:hypothetical protein
LISRRSNLTCALKTAATLLTSFYKLAVLLIDLRMRFTTASTKYLANNSFET